MGEKLRVRVDAKVVPRGVGDMEKEASVGEKERVGVGARVDPMGVLEGV